MPRSRHSPYRGDHVNTSALTKAAVALTLAALAVLGTAACTATGASDAKSSSAKAASRPTPSLSVAPGTLSPTQADSGTKMECLALESKLMGSAAGLQSALATVSAGGDPSSAVPQLESFQNDLDAEAKSVSDPALKAPAQKLNADYDALVATVKASAAAFAAKDAAAAKAQSAKLQSQKSALMADATELQGLCS